MATMTAICAIIGFTCMLLVLLEIGIRLGKARHDVPGLNTVSGAVFGLMGLLIAFTFSGAALRFDERRRMIVEEVNAIATAYLRIDLLPAALQPVVRNDLRDYLDARLDIYREMAGEHETFRVNRKAVDDATGRVRALQKKIWNECVAALQAENLSTRSLVLPTLNIMFDISTRRLAAQEMHPPLVIYLTLIVFVFGATVIAGHAMAGTDNRNRTHRLLYAVILSTAIYVIADLEYPRWGLIRVDAADHLLVDLRSTM